MAKKKSVAEKFQSFLKTYSRATSQNIVATTFNKARKNVAFTKFLKYYTHAQYSAILDSRVCPWCRKLDGGIIKTTDMRFVEGLFDPPQHKWCRCIWVYISKFEKVKANWKLTAADIEQHLDSAHLKKLKVGGLL
jgi:SPP1 gp7 family putative phage head morphogenesis protein